MSNGKKSKVEMVLMPLVVAIVGIAGTLLITAQQEKNARTLGDSQLECTRELAEADRQIKILEIFSEKVTSTDAKERMLALRLLRSLDGELAQKLATAVLEGEATNSEVHKVADEIVVESKIRARQLQRVFIHIRSESQRQTANAVTEWLKEEGYIMPGIELLREKGPARNQLRYFKKAEEKEARIIAGILAKHSIEVTVVYLKRYEQSGTIGPGHFELWMAR